MGSKNKGTFARIAVPRGENSGEFKNRFVTDFNAKVEEGPKVKGKTTLIGATISKIVSDDSKAKTFSLWYDGEPNKGQEADLQEFGV